MTIFLTVIHVIVCTVLIGVILLQAGRGQGLGTSFGGGEGTKSIFGTRSADFLSKATSVCAILFLVTCVGLDIAHARRSRSLFETTKTVDAKDLDALKEAIDELGRENADTGESAAVAPATEAPTSETEAPADASQAGEPAEEADLPAV